MFEFKELEKMNIDELFRTLGMADFTYIETSSFIDRLDQYRSQIYQQIKEKQDVSKSLDQIGSNK